MCFAIAYTIVFRSSFMYSSISLSPNLTFIIDFHNISFLLASIFLFVSLLSIDLYVCVFYCNVFSPYIFVYMQLFLCI
jgi:hypothetical protein